MLHFFNLFARHMSGLCIKWHKYISHLSNLHDHHLGIFILESFKIKCDAGWSGVMFVPRFVKICQLVRKLLGRTQGHDTTIITCFRLKLRKWARNHLHAVVLFVWSHKMDG
jgi:hypothetical protein